MDPICSNKELSPAPSPASFHINVYGGIKVNPPSPVFGWLRLGGIQITLHQQELLYFWTVSPQVPGVFALQSCYAHGALPEPCVPIAGRWHRGWPGWPTTEQVLPLLPLIRFQLMVSCFVALAGAGVPGARAPLVSVGVWLASLCLLHQCCFVLCGYECSHLKTAGM